MDAPVYKKLSDIESRRENPFQTPFGQDVVSIEESFEARLYRQGRMISSSNGAGSLGVVSNSNSLSITASPGCELFPLYFTFSANQDCYLLVQYITNLSQNQVNGVASANVGTMYEPVFLKAGTPYCRNLKGEIRLFEGGSLNLLVTTTIATTIYCSAFGIEVTTNA